MTLSCLAFTLLLIMIDVRRPITLRRRGRWWGHRSGVWLLPALRRYTEVCPRVHWLPSLLQRNLPLANAATPDTLRMKRNKGDPAELKPCSRLGLKYGSVIASWTYARRGITIRFNLCRASKNYRQAKEEIHVYGEVLCKLR